MTRQEASTQFLESLTLEAETPCKTCGLSLAAEIELRHKLAAALRSADFWRSSYLKSMEEVAALHGKPVYFATPTVMFVMFIGAVIWIWAMLHNWRAQ